MDIDDGYILWTGIWKGELILPTTNFVCIDDGSVALGNSKGTVKRTSILFSRVLTCHTLSRHCENDRLSARPRSIDTKGEGWLPQDPGYLDAL